MNNTDLDSLINYIKDILFKKFPEAPLTFENPKEQTLAEALFYLSNSIKEMNGFLLDLSSGNLNALPPGRKNFLAGELKDLHSSLLHLVWQAKQVAKGDYKQKVNFLGDFSEAFNVMVEQLSDREIQLSRKADYISRSLTLLTQVLNTLPEWVFVRKVNSPEILYKNLAAENIIEKGKNNDLFAFSGPLFEFLTTQQYPDDYFKEEFACPSTEKVFSIEGYPMDWQGTNAIILIVKDITDAKAQEEMLTDIAYKDPLTGLYNRWFMEERLENFLYTKKPFSLCFIDMDNLKYVNDTFGHKCGDEYISAVANILQKDLRTNDIICRIGGDEFVVILPKCSLEIAEKKFYKIYLDVIEASPPEYDMSISYGILQADKDSEESSESILKKADEIMYENKKSHKKLEVIDYQNLS